MVSHKPYPQHWPKCLRFREVRGETKHFLYSKVMMWVALDRGLRLADKRVLPCPNRMKWLETRDKLYEEIQEKGWNSEKKFFSQSYEMKESLDSAVCESSSPLDYVRAVLR